MKLRESVGIIILYVVSSALFAQLMFALPFANAHANWQVLGVYITIFMGSLGCLLVGE